MNLNINLIDLEENQIDSFWEDFNEISLYCENSHAVYSRDYYSYQKEYCISNKTFVYDQSFIIKNNNNVECAGLFFLTKNLDSKNLEINFGNNLPGILLIKEDVNSNSIRILKEKISNLLENSDKIIFTVPISYKLNKAYENIFNNFKFTQNINWTKSICADKRKELLWKNIRKSYKSPINKGLKKQSFHIIDAFNLDREKFKTIKELHFDIAGRKTRSDKTWDLQYAAIKNDRGFAFLSYDEETKVLNSAVYFFKSINHAYYTTGLYTEYAKRNLYGYSIIWKVILYCIDRKISLCELDENVKFNGINKIEKKLIDISFLKSGFGGDLSPRLIFSISK